MNRTRLIGLAVIALLLCGSSVLCAADEPGFCVATFSADLTLPLGEPIYSSYKPLAEIEHPLLAKGIVLEYAGQRYVLCAIDWCTISNGTHRLFREKLAEAAGTEPGHVTVHTVHQHTAPMGDADAFDMLARLDDPPPHPNADFFRNATTRLAEAVRTAIDRLEPFDRVGLGQARVERVAATRRVLAPDGTIRIRWSSCKEPNLRAEPEGRIDPMLKTVTFARGKKPLVRLHYYTVHPQSFYGDPRASYDFPGIARERLQDEEGVFQVYFTGCAGDVTAGKYNDGTPEARQRLAEQLHAGMVASIASTEWLAPAPIAWRTTDVLFTPRQDAGHALADYQSLMHDEGKSALQRIGAARRISFLERAQTPIEISCLRMGPLCLLHLPGESMVEYQLYAQGLLPECFVATAAYGDDGPAYICTEEAFEQGGYEPSASAVAPESEGTLKAAIRRLLDVNVSGQ